ncbi:MAG: UvrD-helicase domain-containing protein [Calditrichaeota bacterium]|nr:UvrD-helicase domain-containing protein [Calditrichota bacterium]
MNLNHLNPAQKQAVLTESGPVLVLAGAGSGKTRVITHRIAHLILTKGIQPDQILAVTFTNKAANEMRERVFSLLKRSAKGLQVSTFHSWGVRFLKQHIDKIGYQSNLTITDENSRLNIIKQGLKQYKVDEKRFDPKILLAQIGLAKNKGLSGQHKESHNDLVFEQIFKFYQQRLRLNNLVDFDDLLLLPYEIMETHKNVQLETSVKLKYILVDEYQDTNHIQNCLLEQLADYHKNIFVVGDDDQSIYSWRGAQASNILNFDKRWPNCEVIKLEQNYRSSQRILNAANSLIKLNTVRNEKRLWSNLGNGDLIRFHKAANDREEAEFIVDQIRAFADDFHYSDYAVLYRRNTQSRPVEEVFRVHGLPYKLVGAYNFYDRREIKLILDYLNVIQNHSNELSLEKIINTPPRGIGASTFDKISRYAHAKNITVFDALANIHQLIEIDPSKRDRVEAFHNLIKNYVERFNREPISDVCQDLLKEIHFSAYLEKIAKDEKEFRQKSDNVQEFIYSLKDFENRFNDKSLGAFLERISVLNTDDNDDQNPNAVTIMSLHAAKGLEYPVVFIVGMEEGIFPSKRTLEESDDVSEERRLCYVGITRAKKHLFLLQTNERRYYNEMRKSEPSRFLNEIPAELFEVAPKDFENEEIRAERAKFAANDFFANLKKMRELD